jgi:asparagine synthase (glutamine-hydrolysing)
MFLLCKWINENFPHKVIFSGEGSDELFCGYLYFHKAPTSQDAILDSQRLVLQLYNYDVLRAERCTSDNSLELREPFLDQDLVNFVWNIGSLKTPIRNIEKYLLRKAFEGCLPDEILWRKKEAFSDAVSNTLGTEKLWFQRIQDFTMEHHQCTEPQYYKKIFNKYFNKYTPDIKLWLPNWCDTNGEPSATILKI